MYVIENIRLKQNILSVLLESMIMLRHLQTNIEIIITEIRKNVYKARNHILGPSPIKASRLLRHDNNFFPQLYLWKMDVKHCHLYLEDHLTEEDPKSVWGREGCIKSVVRNFTWRGVILCPEMHCHCLCICFYMNGISTFLRHIFV